MLFFNQRLEFLLNKVEWNEWNFLEIFDNQAVNNRKINWDEESKNF